MRKTSKLWNKFVIDLMQPHTEKMICTLGSQGLCVRNSLIKNLPRERTDCLQRNENQIVIRYVIGNPRCKQKVKQSLKRVVGLARLLVVPTSVPLFFLSRRTLGFQPGTPQAESRLHLQPPLKLSVAT